MPSLVFKDAEQARDSICIEDQKRIRDLYADWADKVAERAEFYEKKTTASSYWQQQQMLELERQLRSQSLQIHKEIGAVSRSSMHMVADSVVGCNAEFLKALGFKEEGINAAFTSVPDKVVSNIVTGQIYKSGWSLSKAIWTDNQKTLSDIYSIVAQGRAMNMSAYEVSKMLEKYVSPGRKMQWNLKMNDGVKIYKKTVDYNAQRLVRTLNQHAYQQSVIQVVKDNPFIPGIYWRANGSRVCPLCMDRDGNFYKWSELPMDHPNGMCTMEPATDMDKTIDQLADWINSPDGTYPEIDEFAKKLGYEPTPTVINAGLPNEQKINSAHYVAQGKDITDIWKRRAERFDFEIEDVINAQGFDGLPRVVSKGEFDEAVKAANGGNGFIAQRAYSAPNQEALDAYRDQLYDGKWYVDCSVGGARHGQGMYCIADYDGTITSEMKSEAESYASYYGSRPSYIETFTVDPSAKFIEEDTVRKMMNAYNEDVRAASYSAAVAETTRPESVNSMVDKYKKYYGVTMTADEMTTYMKGMQLKNMESDDFTGSLKKQTNQIIKKYKLKDHSLVQSAYRSTGAYKEASSKEYTDIGSFAAASGWDGIKVSGREDQAPYAVILNRTKVIFLKED